MPSRLLDDLGIARDDRGNVMRQQPAVMRARATAARCAVLMLLAGCGPSTTPGVSSADGFITCAVTPPSSSAEPVAAEGGLYGACEVLEILFERDGVTCKPAGAYAASAVAAACPVTSALAAGLARQTVLGDPICRCSGAFASAAYRVAQVQASTTRYTTKVTLRLDDGVATSLDVIVAQDESGFLADDILCANGDATTSIRSSSAAPCGP